MKPLHLLALICFVCLALSSSGHAQTLPNEQESKPSVEWYDFQDVKMRALDKITARTTSFDLKVGEAVRFGDIFLKVQACRRPPLIEKEESAAFVQVWEKPVGQTESRWIFSGWMFASQPALSAMDHPIYDVWLIQCVGDESEPETEIEERAEDLIEGLLGQELPSGVDE